MNGKISLIWRTTLKLVMAVFCLLSGLDCAHATDYYWTNATATAFWTNSAWNPPGYPGTNTAGATDAMIYTSALAQTISINVSPLLSDGYFRQTANTATLSINSGKTLTFTNSLWVGDLLSSTGSVAIILTGTLAVTNAGGTAQFIIGGAGRGTFTAAGAAAAGGATPNLVADTIIVGYTNAASYSSGTLRQTVGGSLIEVGTDLVVGKWGTGTFTMSGTSVTNLVYRNLVVGEQPSGLGNVLLNSANGLLTVTNGGSGLLAVGAQGAGSVTLSAGTLLADNVLIATNAGTAGTFTWTGGALSVGGVSDPSTLFNQILAASGNGGTVTAAQWGSNNVQGLSFGVGAVTNNFYNGLVLGYETGGTGSLSVAGGVLAVTNAGSTAQLVVGQNGGGSYTLGGGTLLVNQLLVTNNTPTATNSFFNFTGGTLTTSNDNAVAANIVIASNSTFTINGSWNMVAGTNLITQTVSGGGTKLGTVVVGNGVSNAVVSVASNATWNLGALNLAIGSGSASGNMLIVNGGMVTNTAVVTIGNVGGYNSLVISNGGTVFSSSGVIGTNANTFSTQGTFNSALVTGTGSVWNVSGGLVVGFTFTQNGDFGGVQSSRNSLVISNGGQVIANNSTLSFFVTTGASGGPGYSNSVVVSGYGSVFSNSGGLTIGNGGGGNYDSLLITNGGVVLDSSAVVAGNYGSVTVTGNGSIWTNTGAVNISGSFNTISVLNSGKVFSTSITLGVGNLVTISGTGTVWKDTGTFAISSLYGQGTSSVTVANGGALATAGAGTSYIGRSDQYPAYNQLIVTDPGSTWSNSGSAIVIGGGQIGNNGPQAYNGLIVSNGGQAYLGGVQLSVGAGSIMSNNYLWVTGTNSVLNGIGTLQLAASGTGGNWLTNSNGGLLVSAATTIGAAGAGSNNSAVVTDPGSSWTNTGALVVGSGSTGNSLTISNGGFVSSVGSTIGNATSANNNRVLVTGAGSTWTNAGALTMGNSGSSNTLTVAAAATVFSASATLGNAYSTVTTNFAYILPAGGNTNQAAVTTRVDGSGNAAWLTDTGTLWKIAGTLTLGNATASNSLTIANGALLVDSNAVVGNLGTYQTNVLTITATTTPPTATVTVVTVTNWNSLSSILVTDPGSLWTNRTTVTLGNTGAGNTLTVSNQAAVVASNLSVGAAASATGNVVTVVAGGALSATSLILGAGPGATGNQLNLSGNSSTVTVQSLFISNGNAVVFSGGVLNAAAITNRSGAAFTVGDGLQTAVLNLLGGVQQMTNGLVINPNGVLTGTGKITGDTLNAGRLAPGSAAVAGLLTNVGNFTLTGTAASQFKIGGTGAGQWDQLFVVGDLTLTGRLDVALLNNFTPTALESFLIMTNTLTLTGNPYSFTNVFASAGLPTVDVFTNGVVAGTFTVVTNATSVVLTNYQASGVVADPYTEWQLKYFNCTACPQAAGEADPDGDGQSNTNEFLAGTVPTNSVSVLRVLGVARSGVDVVVTWSTSGGDEFTPGPKTNVVEYTVGQANGSYSNNFVSTGLTNIIGTVGDVVTNAVDLGGATNVPARYYRVRLLP